MSDKKFCGNGKKFGNFGGIKLGIKVSDLVINEKGWANIIVSPKRDDPETFYAYVDEWKKGDRSEERKEQERQGFQPTDPLPDDKNLPF